MEIDKVFSNDVDGVADNLFSAVKNSVSEIKAMQQRKAAENVQLVIQALKKIESDLQDKFDGVTTVIEKRVSTIKDGRDGLDGRNGRDGKDGRPGRDGAPGARGPAGVPGTNGRDGEDGVSVTDARIDFDGSLIISLSSGREINVGEVVAPDLAEKIKVITNGGGTSQSVLDSLASLQTQITALQNLGAVNYVGTWNASTNSPTITSGSGDKGDYYVVSVAGSTNIDGQTLWGVGDWIIFNGAVWQKVDGGSTGDFTNLSASGTVTFSGGTANGVAYLNGSKVLTTGSALTFDGTNLGVGGSLNTAAGRAALTLNAATDTVISFGRGGTSVGFILQDAGGQTFYNGENTYQRFYVNASEQMRLTSTGLGIGTSSPNTKLQVNGNAVIGNGTIGAPASGYQLRVTNDGSEYYDFGRSSSTGYFTINASQASPYRGFIWAYGGTSQMTLDSSGNLGLGVTPSSWGSNYRAVEVSGAVNVFGNTGDANFAGIGANLYHNNTNYLYRYSTLATMYLQDNGTHQWHTAASGTAGQTITFTQAMTLDASGNLGVGTSSPASKLDVVLSDNGNIDIRQNASASTGFLSWVDSDGERAGRISYDHSSNALRFATAASGTATERARITSGGYSKFSNSGAYVNANTNFHEIVQSEANTTAYFANLNATAANNYGINISFRNADPNGTGNHFIYCEANGSTQRMSVRSNGGIANYSANDVNLSDRREKTNFAPAKSYLDTICAIPVQTFNYIDQSENDPGLTLGVVAQDVQAVAPELVMESNWGTEDNPKMRLSIYQTDLQYALMKALQELKSELDSVKAELATLKGA